MSKLIDMNTRNIPETHAAGSLTGENRALNSNTW